VPIAVGGLGKFRSGVLWLGIEGDLDPLERACREALGLPAERYRPHITLARGYHGPLPDLAMPPHSPGFTVSELTLFASELMPTGARHTVVARFPLGQPG
jgi:2'-5' RNA ligase